MSKRVKFAVVFHHIGDIHIKKDPLLIPINMMRLGVESFIITYTNDLTTERGLPRVITLDTYPIPPANKGPIGYIHYIAGEIKYANALLGVIKKEKPDAMLFYYDPLTVWIIRMFNPDLKIAYKLDIGFASDIGKLPYPKVFVKLAYMLKASIADLLIVETQEGYNGVLAIAPSTRKKLKLIRNGIPRELFLQPGERSAKRKMVLSVARVARVKGIDVLIRSFAKLKDRYKDWTLELVGPVEDAKYHEELKKLVKSLHLGTKVRFRGFISEDALRKEYLKAGIFCLSSYTEGSSASRLEAMAMGIPVISTRTGGSEMIEGRGIVIAPGDIDALEKALAEFMSSKARREEAGKAEIAAAKKMRAEKQATEVLNSLGFQGGKHG